MLLFLLGSSTRRVGTPRRWIAPAVGACVFAVTACATRERGARPGDSARAAERRDSNVVTASDSVRDDFGDQVAIGEAAPRRILSLDPGVTEVLFALGAGPQLVGRTHWDLYSDSARALPDIGDGIRPNVEAILATRPDLVFLYAGRENRDASSALRRAGVRVVALKIDRIDAFRRVTELAGRLTGREARARDVVDSVTATLARVRRATAAVERPTVLFHVWENPLLTIGKGSFFSELVDIAGGRNVFDDLADPSPQVAFEEVLRRNPDVLLVSPATAAALRESSKWQALPAVRNGRILEMDTVLVARPSVRLGEAAVSFARLLHPGLVR